MLFLSLSLLSSDIILLIFAKIRKGKFIGILEKWIKVSQLEKKLYWWNCALAMLSIKPSANRACKCKHHQREAYNLLCGYWKSNGIDSWWFSFRQVRNQMRSYLCGCLLYVSIWWLSIWSGEHKHLFCNVSLSLVSFLKRCTRRSRILYDWPLFVSNYYTFGFDECKCECNEEKRCAKGKHNILIDLYTFTQHPIQIDKLLNECFHIHYISPLVRFILFTILIHNKYWLIETILYHHYY